IFLILAITFSSYKYPFAPSSFTNISTFHCSSLHLNIFDLISHCFPPSSLSHGIIKNHVHVSHHPPPPHRVLRHCVRPGLPNSGSRRRRSWISFRLCCDGRSCGCLVHACHLQAMSSFMLCGFVYKMIRFYDTVLFSDDYGEFGVCI
ncbi:hypothetical protein VIGAN_07187900, partial [Vigna angularis var. angularis]